MAIAALFYPSYLKVVSQFHGSLLRLKHSRRMDSRALVKPPLETSPSPRPFMNGELKAQVEFDFGTWRRTVVADFFLLDRGAIRIAKAHNLHYWYWSYGVDIPILDKHLFQITMENAACSAGFLTTAIERALLGKENQSVEADR